MKEKVYEKRTIILTVTVIDRTGFSVFYLKDHFVYSKKIRDAEMSEYGKGNYAEFFAEASANFPCGRPALIGIAVRVPLKWEELAKE